MLLTPSSTASSSTELVDIDEEGEVVQRPPASRATHGEQSDRPTAGPQVPRPARPHAARPTQPRTGPIDGSPDGSFAPESGRSGRLLPNRTMAQGTQLQQQQQQAIKKPRHRVGSAPPGEKTGEKDVESVESEGVDKFGRSVKAQGKSTNRSTQENTRGVITESGGVGTGPAGAAGRERPGPPPTPGSNSNRTRRDASPANTGRAVPVLLLSTRSRESTDVEEESTEHLPPVSDRSAIAMASASSTYSMNSSRRHRARFGALLLAHSCGNW